MEHTKGKMQSDLFISKEEAKEDQDFINSLKDARFNGSDYDPRTR